MLVGYDAIIVGAATRIAAVVEVGTADDVGAAGFFVGFLLAGHTFSRMALLLRQERYRHTS